MATTDKTNLPRVPARRLPRRVSQLFAGLVLYGVSMAFMIRSGLGLNPWDVFHQGVSKATGISFGWVVILTGIPIMLLWIPLRQRPGFGTIANLILIGVVVDLTLAVLPAVDPLAAEVTFLVTGIVLNGVATGLYLGARLGSGPRDGLMTGVVARFPRTSIRLVRTAIELSVLGIGFLLGGTVGVGTVAYALGIGPLAQVFLRLFTVAPAASGPTESGPDGSESHGSGPVGVVTTATGPVPVTSVQRPVADAGPVKPAEVAC